MIKPLPDEPPLDVPSVERVERNLRYLDEMIEIGMKLARAVGQQALDQIEAAQIEAPVKPGAAKPAPAADARALYSKITLSVQRAMALQGALGAQRTELIREVRFQANRNVERVQDERRALVQGIVDETIATQKRTRIRRDVDLVAQLHNLMHDRAFERALRTQPVSTIVAGLCASLGIEPDWERWEDEDWALAEAEAEVPGTPYVLTEEDDPEFDDDKPDDEDPVAIASDATGPP